MIFSRYKYGRFVWAAIGLALLAYGAIGDHSVMLLTGGTLVVWGVLGGISRLRGGVQAGDKTTTPWR
jgi:hypothetical protein